MDYSLSLIFAFLWLQQGKGNHITNTGAIGQHHHEAIDANT
jgi:hypothetical protein